MVCPEGYVISVAPPFYLNALIPHNANERCKITGNYYSIENDYDQPARIFFAQGCEMTSNSADFADQSNIMTSVEADQSQAE